MSYPYDPELAAAVPHLPALDYADLASTRAAVEQIVTEPDLNGVTVHTAYAPAAGGTVPLLVTTPNAGDRPWPVIYDIHPGAFSLGSARMMHPRGAVLAREVGAIVVAPDYRLAPEHPYPTPLDDCYTGLAWVAENAEQLGADPDRIALYGMSAGGGLAAGVALLARDRGTPNICFQYLAYPEIDDRLDTSTMKRFVDTPLFNRPNAEISWKNYLGDLTPGSPDVPVYAAPARATDLSGLPATYISAMQFDPLRDEVINYAQRLLDADVAVELHLFPATFHWSRAIETAEISQREMAEEIPVLTRAIHGITTGLTRGGPAAELGRK